MDIGEIVLTKSIESHSSCLKPALRIGFKPMKGWTMVFLCLGNIQTDAELDAGHAEKVLNHLGWFRKDESAAS